MPRLRPAMSTEAFLRWKANMPGVPRMRRWAKTAHWISASVAWLPRLLAAGAGDALYQYSTDSVT
jgi:hypothetical protein